MTRIAYLLLVHQQPKQTAYLVRALAHVNSFLFIHVDARADKNTFEEAIQKEAGIANVTFIADRVHGLWGHFSLVEASLLLLKKAVANSTPFDHFVLLSGQDFPLKSNTYISQFLSKYKGYDFIEYYSLPSDKLREKQGGLYRVNRYHQIAKKKHSEFPPYSKKPVLNALFNAWANWHHSAVRKMPLSMQPYAGSQWWLLSRDTVVMILSFLKENKEVENFFQNVWIPDEIFFQTVLYHLKGDDPCIINKNYRFIEWEKKADLDFISNPKELTVLDFEQLQKTEALFARKFDEIQSSELLQQLLKLHSEADALLSKDQD